ncbi:MAG: YoaK family protein [Phycisphaerae bacterium]|nr:YoaK family protein [Phycisphaerae bacterium]
MFVAQAHSFVQQARLAITLAWVAGYTNILTVITCGTATSHVSGTTSNLGREVAEGRWNLVWFSTFLLVTFGIGAAASGTCAEVGRRRGWQSIYVLPIAIEGLLLGLFAVILEVTDPNTMSAGASLYWLIGIASLAMGLQNATITRISSGVVRTTHVTGVLTDLGLEAAQFAFWMFDRSHNSPPLPQRAFLRSLNVHPTARRLALLASILGSFCLGALLGTLAHEYFTRWAMFPPVLFLAWIIYRDVRTPIAEIETSHLLGSDIDLQLPPSIAVFHMRKEKHRGDRAHRMPNLLAWADRLPATARVVVLDLGEHSSFDGNDAMELRAVLARFAEQHRRLVIAGVGGEQFHQIRHVADAGHIDHGFLDPTNFCPDLELAIARALVLVD